MGQSSLHSSASTVDLRSDLVEDPLSEQPHTQLKARSQQLVWYDKVKKLSQIPPLGAQKSSELLAAMLKLRPRGQESLPFFTFFLPTLPSQKAGSSSVKGGPQGPVCSGSQGEQTLG
jgi:hypothetical protein